MNNNENNTAAATAQELAAQQQEREQRARRIAATILSQITADPARLCDSWAMEYPAAILWKCRAGLIFRVNALQHRGSVLVLLDEGRDLYDVRTLNDKSETIEERRAIFCDDLAAQIDEMVERPATMTDAEYIAALRKLGNPVLNWALDKREAGQKGKIILV